jgi:long-subunit fatty acid transport protein
MILRHSNKALASALVLSILGGQSALAAGFEKSILWSGKYAGQGNAAVSSATGAEALYFNPANLAGSKGSEISANVSPTFSKFNGPVTSSATVAGKRLFSPSFGALGSYAINEKLGIGVGAYVSAGAKAESEAVTAGGKTHTPLTNLSAIEYAVGAGYEVLPGLKIGGSYRITQVQADFTFMREFGTSSGTPNGSVSLSDMKATNAKGYRLGASYTGNGWGLGANYRGAVDFTLEGTSSGIIPAALGNGTFTGGAATAASTLPAQLSVGGFYDLAQDLSVNLEYVNTQYSKVNQITLSGAINVGGGPNNLSAVPMNWADQTNYRVGAIYKGIAGWTLRGGYVYTSQVTNAALARATLTPPGVAHSVTAGFSTDLTNTMELNVAGEASRASGTGTATVAAATQAGDYSATGYIVHTGVNYKF